MDTPAAISSEWIPSKISLAHELPAMPNAPFASIKQEPPHLNGDTNRQETINKENERTDPFSKKISSDHKIETANGVHCRLSPIRINHRAQIDVIDMREKDSRVYKSLLIYEEQYSKFVVLRALRSSEPGEVAAELADIVTTIGAPRIIQSGNGREYAEQVVREIRTLLRDFCVVHGDAAKNCDERRNLKNSVKSWMEKNPGKSWHECLRTLQVLENTSINPRNGTIPSQLFFGRNICDDLRRTVGGKGSLGNTAPEEESISVGSKERDSFGFSKKGPCQVSISGLDIAREKENHSGELLERREDTDEKSSSAKKNANSFDFSRINERREDTDEKSSAKKNANSFDFARINDRREDTDEKSSAKKNANSFDFARINERREDTDEESSSAQENANSFNFSRVSERREDTDEKSSSAKEITNSFNFVSVKSEPPSTTEHITELLSDEEERIDSEKYNFRCKICQKQYMKLGHLRNHTKNHKKVGSYECTICPESFRLSSLYDKHMKKFHDNEKNRERLEENGRDDDDNVESDNRDEKISRKRRRCLPDKSKPIKSEPAEKKSPSSRGSSKRSKSVFRRKHANSTTKLNANPLLECTYCKQKFNFPSVLKRHVRSHTNERPYVCKVCGKSFKQLGHLSQHSLTHTDYRSFQCTICEIKFESLDAFKLHSQSHKDETVFRPKETYRLFECDSCKKVFTTKSVLERHIFTHSHERQFGCKVCGKRFKQAGHVKSHMLVHTGERKFACTVCSKRFSLSNSLKKHMYVHNGEKPYQCDVCGARFLEKRNLNGHLMTHTNERPFSCKICGKRYTLADTLRRHVSAAHEDGRTYQCEICAKMFKQLAHLSVHKKVHNDERPFQCHLCEKNFKHKNVLKSHLAIHANVRPFECDVCKATFVRKTNLQTHIASAHMNERPYVCTICNKRFKQISHLNGHIVVHSNSMPYQCDYCDRRCNRLDNLKKHMRLHTKNKE